MKLEEILPEIRKGRRFRHPKYHVTFAAIDQHGINFGTGTLLSDDWELEPIKKEISREDLARAWAVLVQRRVIIYDDGNLCEAFCKELGLE